MTPRKAAVLATQLPAGAQTWISCGYDSAWTQAEHLAALQFDAIQVANWQRAGDSKAPKPEPIQRPSEHRKKDEKRSRTQERARAFAARNRRLVEDETPTQPTRPRDARGRFAKAR